ncbi:hypothetical protein OROMI_031374 [Orobanche minor]
MPACAPVASAIGSFPELGPGSAAMGSTASAKDGAEDSANDLGGGSVEGSAPNREEGAVSGSHRTLILLWPFILHGHQFTGIQGLEQCLVVSPTREGDDDEQCWNPAKGKVEVFEDIRMAANRELVLLICVTKVAKSAFDKALAEHEDIDDAVVSKEPTERDHRVDLQQPLLIKIYSSDSHKK